MHEAGRLGSATHLGENQLLLGVYSLPLDCPEFAVRRLSLQFEVFLEVFEFFRFTRKFGGQRLLQHDTCIQMVEIYGLEKFLLDILVIFVNQHQRNAELERVF